jgi:hypothetical protein
MYKYLSKNKILKKKLVDADKAKTLYPREYEEKFEKLVQDSQKVANQEMSIARNKPKYIFNYGFSKSIDKLEPLLKRLDKRGLKLMDCTVKETFYGKSLSFQDNWFSCSKLVQSTNSITLEDDIKLNEKLDELENRPAGPIRLWNLKKPELDLDFTSHLNVSPAVCFHQYEDILDPQKIYKNLRDQGVKFKISGNDLTLDDVINTFLL